MISKQLILVQLIFISFSGFAQIKHITTLFYDLDGDSTEDIVFEFGTDYVDVHQISFGYVSVSPKNGTQIADSGYVVKLLSFGDTINQDLSWTTQSRYLYHDYAYRRPELNIAKDFFIGIKFQNNDSAYYGWIRIRGDSGNAVSERDAAIQTVPNVMIKAGEGIQSIAPILGNAYDIYNTVNWSDVVVSFYPPYYNSMVKEYRIFVIKSGNEMNYSVEDLMALPEIKYQKADTGSVDYKVRLKPELLDADGDKINTFIDYKLCVLSVSDNPEIFRSDFSFFPVLNIKTALSKTGKPKATDINDFGDSRDLQIEFVQNQNDAITKEYRILIVPIDSAGDFSIEKAILTDENNCYSLPSTGDSVYTINNVHITDVNGNEIEQDRFYKSFILSVHDSINSNESSLSAASNIFCLGIPNYFYAGQKEGQQVRYVDLGGVNGNPNNLDIDGDGKNDLYIETYHYWINNGQDTEEHNLVTIDNTEIIFDKDSNAINLEVGEPINSINYKWGSGRFLLKYHGYGIRKGNFYWSPGGNAGFRKITEQDTLYGWVRLYGNYESSTIYEYAYQNGTVQSVSIIQEINEKLFNTYPNPNSDRILNIAINNFKAGEEYYVDILNASGIKMKTFFIQHQLSKINLSDVPRGLYFLRLRSNVKQETQKVMLQ